jgi:phenylalanyl-tRNA synthetase beta chain
MLISYNWLRELTDTNATPLDLRERLTMVGLAIDAVAEIEGDSVLDVEVPSNRPDCLSHIGIAREVSVIEKSKVQSPRSKVAKSEGKAADYASVEIQDRGLCPRYAAHVVRGVRIGPSPEWLAKRLGEIGQRPINNVADITNYVLHEMGQPLHAFDLAKLTEHKIVVRRALPGEKLKTLDGVERALDPQMLVIADAKEPVALAGVMGGLDSEISEATADVLIESAYFNPDSVRRTARQLGMDTEASRRFERGADCENVLKAPARWVELICEIAVGVATEDTIDVYPEPLSPVVVPFRPSRIESLTSLQVETSEMMRILSALGFSQESPTGDAMRFVVPSWRVDVSLEEDLVEEIARHTAYDKIKSELPPSDMSGEYQPTEMKRRALRRVLTNLGFDEAINFSFIDTAHDEQFETVPTIGSEVSNAGLVTLENPITEEATRMRPTLLPGLLESVRNNFNHGTRDVRLFEIGRIFAASAGSELPVERDALGLVATGAHTEEGRAQTTSEVDFYDLKGALEAAVDAMKLGSLEFDQSSVKHLRAGQAATIKLVDGKEIGTIGRLSDPIAAAYKFRQPVYVAELDLTALVDSEPRAIQYKPLPRFPSVVRDVTLLISRDVSLSQLLRAVDTQAVADYSGAQLVGTYEGKNIPESKRAVTMRIEYRSDDRTLRDEEVEERHRGLIDWLLKRFSAELH